MSSDDSNLDSLSNLFKQTYANNIEGVWIKPPKEMSKKEIKLELKRLDIYTMTEEKTKRYLALHKELNKRKTSLWKAINE